MSKGSSIYWVEVIERRAGTLDGHLVVQAYPFPDVPFEPFGFDLLLFEQQIEKIEDPILRLCTQTRYHNIINLWHPRQFFKITRKEWKYADRYR